MYSWILVFAVVSASDVLCDPIHRRKLLENPNLYEGDIVLPKGRYGRNAVVSDRRLWPNGTVPYEFRPEIPIWLRPIILGAMKSIEDAVEGCVRFVPHTMEPDYIYFNRSVIGCKSKKGRLGGGQSIDLEWPGCFISGNIIHEIMHALGFDHEHNRSDRDKYLRIHFKNVQKGYKRQFYKLKSWKNRLCGPFDYDSIMIYGSKHYLKPGSDGLTITRRDGDILLTGPGEKDGLSKLDVIKLKRLYRCGEEKPCDPPEIDPFGCQSPLAP